MDLLKLDFPVRVIESERDHEQALQQMAELMAETPAAGSEKERLLKTLAVLVRDYESSRYPIAPPDPVEAIKFRMEQQGLAAKDRLDNFWFVLMHELVHLLKHLGGEASSFYDDLDSDDQSDPREIEADALGGEILIPSVEWRTSPASRLRSADAANHLAQRLRIHPAIVAGRIRRTYKDYRVLSGLVGQGEVRKQFPEFKE